MKRLIRPAVFTVVSMGALVVFLLAERWSVDALDWRDLNAWLERVEPIDALVEVARWLGIILAAYVAVVSVAALLAELSFVVRMPRLGYQLRRLVSAVAFPALRRRLVEVTTAVTITASSINATPALAGAPTPAAAAAVIDGPVDGVATAPTRGEFQRFEGVAGTPPPASGGDTPAGTYVVESGDTLWQILERHYGWADANLVRQVAAVSQIAEPDRIWPGMVVTLPAATPEAVPGPQGEASWSAVTVRLGDSLWGIVERHYGEATSELVWAVADANPWIDDPGLILPGQVITLPPVNGATPELPGPPVTEPAPAVDEAPLPAPPEPTVVTPPATTPETAPDPTPTTTPATPPTTTPAVAEVVPITTHAPRPTPPTTAASESAVLAEGTSDEVKYPPLAAVLRWTGGAGLAAALITLAARRRRRLPTAERHARPSKRGVELGIALHETENVPLVEWASLALRHLGSRLRPRAGEPTSVPRLLRLADDTVEVVWDTPSNPVISPWTSDDGGWSWNLQRGEHLEASDASAPCPGLVTVGRRDGADVLLNLESCGVVALTGDGALPMVRAIATEAATGVFGDAPTVLTIGVRRLPGDPDFARSCDVTEAVGWLHDRADSAGALLAHRRLTSLFALRARSKPHESHQPLVVVVDAESVLTEDLERIVQLANGDLGAVVLVIGEHPSVSWRLECSGTTVTVQPLGLELDPVGVAEELDDLVDEFVPEVDLSLDDPGEDGFEEDDVAEAATALADHLDVIATRQVAPTETPTQEPESEPSVGDALDGAEPDTRWDVELKVLGQVTSDGAKSPLTPTELHLAIYLAFNRGGQSRDTIETMLWPNGVAPRTVTNAMAGLRRKLGTGADGEPLFPTGRNSGHLYRLSTRVITDWDRFVELVRRSDELPTDEALPLLDQALSLVTGPPFRARFGYSWAFSDGTMTMITETIKTVGVCCVDLHTERGELTEAAAAMARVMNATGTDEFV